MRSEPGPTLTLGSAAATTGIAFRNAFCDLRHYVRISSFRAKAAAAGKSGLYPSICSEGRFDMDAVAATIRVSNPIAKKLPAPSKQIHAQTATDR